MADRCLLMCMNGSDAYGLICDLSRHRKSEIAVHTAATHGIIGMSPHRRDCSVFCTLCDNSANNVCLGKLYTSLGFRGQSHVWVHALHDPLNALCVSGKVHA